VCAISSKSFDRAKGLADKYGINKYYDNYNEMLDNEKPDCVYIAVTNNDHYRLTMMCVEKGIPVLSEKAMFQNSDEALSEYADTLLPCVYDDFIAEAKSVMTPELQEKVRHLVNFKFKKNPRYNLDNKRLKLIEKQIQKRARILLQDQFK
jgi:hypothetical protein